MANKSKFLFVILSVFITVAACEKQGSRAELISFFTQPYAEKYAFLFHTDDREKIIVTIGRDYTSLVEQKKNDPKSGFALSYEWGSFVYSYANGFYQLRHLEIRDSIPLFSHSFFFGGSKKAVLSRYGKPDRDFGDGLMYGMSKDLMNAITFSFTDGKLSMVSIEFLVTDNKT
jgi:hypothetical protein